MLTKDALEVKVTKYNIIQANADYCPVTMALAKQLDIFEKEYHFPSEKMSVIEKIKNIQNDNFYKKMINKQLKWSKNLYEPFNEKYFIEVIR